jgi:hypothetical protein
MTAFAYERRTTTQHGLTGVSRDARRAQDGAAGNTSEIIGLSAMTGPLIISGLTIKETRAGGAERPGAIGLAVRSRSRRAKQLR